MKKDPFADLGGLDQQLFRENPIRAEASVYERARKRVNEQASARASESSSELSDEPTIEPSLEPSKQRTLEATRTRVSTLRGDLPRPRPKERHSHDLFRDQTLWMNKLKLEIEEKYGRRVTGNEIVQTAIELLRADYTAHKNDSTLIRVLVKREVLEESGGGAGREAEAA